MCSSDLVSDGQGGTDTGDLAVTFTPVNDLPVAVDDPVTVNEDQPATGNVLTNDTDADGTPLTVTDFSINGTTYQPGQTATLPGIGTITVGPDGSFTFTPVANYAGPVPPVNYTVSDGNGGTDTGILAITITPVPDAPVAVDDTKTVPEDTPATGSVLTNDTDAEGDPLTVTSFEIGGVTYTAGQTATIPNVGTLVINADGTYTFTPVPNYNGAAPVATYTVSDGNGGTDTGKIGRAHV